MSRILLVARRDFLQIISTRAFKITLLIVPLMLGLVILGTSFMRPPPTVAYIVADTGGGIAPVIAGYVAGAYGIQYPLYLAMAAMTIGVLIGISLCTAPGSLDNRVFYAACLKVSSCQAARMSAGLR